MVYNNSHITAASQRTKTNQLQTHRKTYQYQILGKPYYKKKTHLFRFFALKMLQPSNTNLFWRVINDFIV